MKTVWLFVALLLWIEAVAALEQFPYNPKSKVEAIVTHGHVRFTVLTSEIIRY